MRNSKVKKLITHDGPFHCDDIFACATLSLFLEGQKEVFEIIRTREKKIIEEGDYVFDVGEIYSEEENSFDHHQKGGAGKRKNGIEYASFGLVWKKFGPKLSGSEIIAQAIDQNLVSPIDADDNGISLFKKTHKISPFLIQDLFKLMRPTSIEEWKDYDKNFLKSVKFAREIILRNIAHVRDAVLAEENVLKTYQESEDKKIIILEKYHPFKKVFEKLPEPLFVIFPRENKSAWVVKAVNKEGDEFKCRKDFPSSWAGLQDEEFQKITRVSDAIFCHKGLFLAVAKSKKGAIKLAQIAVES